MRGCNSEEDEHDFKNKKSISCLNIDNNASLNNIKDTGRPISI